MQDEDLFDFLLSRWEIAAPEDRLKVFRELCAEIRTSFAGREGGAAFLGSFLGEATGKSFPDVDDKQRRALLAVAKKAMEDDPVEQNDDDEEDDRPLSTKELKEKRRRTKVDREALLDEFNNRYAVVKDGGSALIFDDCYDDTLGRQFYDRMKPAALLLLYAARKVCTRVDDDGKQHFQPAARWWLNNPNRREFINGTTFLPGKEPRQGFLNLWRGLGVEPRKGTWGEMKTHIREIVCSGNPAHFDYLMGWMAKAVQKPSERAEVAVVLRGETRIGKGILGHAMRRLFGQHGMHVSSSKHLVGNFNAHLRDCVFLFADEAFFAGDKANISTLKALITEEVVTIEAKYMNALQARNMLHILMASNDDWVIPAAIGEERFFVLDVQAAKKGNRKYFEQIHAELEAGGYEAMLHDLLHYDLAGFDIRNVPKTAALADQKQFSLPTTFAWLREVIEREYVFESKLGLEDTLHVWMELVSVQLVYASYRVFAKERGERHPLHQGALAEFLTDKLGWEIVRPRQYNMIVGEHMRGKEPEVVLNKSRPRCVKVGTIENARKAFQAATGLSIDVRVDEDQLETDATNVVAIQAVNRGNGLEVSEYVQDDVPF